ncbi:MAG: capsule assembly Wzi family protein [Candidatus Kapabacteria bacterium]|nr:capsule assembly Wzi family protein [Candidatus Kapabacteria bacterium]
MQTHRREAVTGALRLALLPVLLLTVMRASAQNVDVQSERVSLDAALLRAVNGSASVGHYAVWPGPLHAALDSLHTDAYAAYDAWTRDYYGRGDRWHLWKYADFSLSMVVDGALMGRAGTTDDGSSSEAFLLGRPSVRVMGSIDDTWDFMVDLSNGQRFAGTSARIARTDPTLGRTFKFVAEEQTFFDRYIGYVQYRSEHLRVRYGREALQFGFSPIDNLVHSIEAPPMDGILVDVPFKNVRFTFTHHQAEGLDTNNRSVPGKYIATHRLSVDPWPWLSVSVSDMIVYWNRGIDLVYLNPLAFFVSAGLGTKQRSDTDNSLLAFDVALRPIDGTMVYGTLVIDDLAFSTLRDTSFRGNNNKFAFQGGISQAMRVGTRDLLLTAEYARITPFTYSHRTLNASYTHMGASAGYDMQPNSDRLAVQATFWFTPRTSVRIDVDYTRHGENILDAFGNILVGEDPRFPGAPAFIGNVGGDVTRGESDFLQGNRFLRGNVSYQRRIDAVFSAEVFRNVFTDVRVGYTNRNGGNRPGEFFFGAAEVRIGY